MKNFFIYPTQRNSLVLFVLFQFLPILTFIFTGAEANFLNWLKFELVILGTLAIWRIKPIDEMSEKERFIELKWKNRMLEFSLPMVLIPITWLSVAPEASGWEVINSFTIPVFTVLVIFSLLMKKEMGGLFYRRRYRRYR
jgi:hypothetical protein